MSRSPVLSICIVSVSKWTHFLKTSGATGTQSQRTETATTSINEVICLGTSCLRVFNKQLIPKWGKTSVGECRSGRRDVGRQGKRRWFGSPWGTGLLPSVSEAHSGPSAVISVHLLAWPPRKLVNWREIPTQSRFRHRSYRPHDWHQLRTQNSETVLPHPLIPQGACCLRIQLNPHSSKLTASPCGQNRSATVG